VDPNELQFTFQAEIPLLSPILFDQSIYPVGFQSYVYAMGWVVSTYRGRTMYWHDGGTVGHSTITAFLPDEDIGFVFLSNMQNRAIGALNVLFTALDVALGFEPWINTTTACTFPCPWAPGCTAAANEKVKQAEVKNPTKQEKVKQAEVKNTKKQEKRQGGSYEEYTGTYTDPAWGSYEISLDQNGNLVAVYGNTPCTMLDDRGNGGFDISCVPPYDVILYNYPIQFLRGYTGEVTGMLIPYMDFSIPSLVFSKADAEPNLWHYPRYDANEAFLPF